MENIKVDESLCKLCGLCVHYCRRGALKITDSGNEMTTRMEVNQENCNGCTLCAIICPDAAITIYRR